MQHLAGKKIESELEVVVDRYRLIAVDLGLGEDIIDIIEKDLRERLSSNLNDESLFTDCIKAAGEDNNAKVIAANFSHTGLRHSMLVRKRQDYLLVMGLGTCSSIAGRIRATRKNFAMQKG